MVVEKVLVSGLNEADAGVRLEFAIARAEVASRSVEYRLGGVVFGDRGDSAGGAGVSRVVSRCGCASRVDGARARSASGSVASACAVGLVVLASLVPRLQQQLHLSMPTHEVWWMVLAVALLVPSWWEPWKWWARKRVPAG